MGQTKQKTTATERVIASMLKENTGRHFLDSGMENGRHWQQNAARDFAKEPAATLSGRYDYINVELNVYHWLVDRLEYDPALQRSFDRYAAKRPDDGWLEIIEEFCTERGYTGLYGEGAPICVNTYNGESLLSQVLQYTYFTHPEKGECVLLQIHGGADVRGGYTAPKAFQVTRELGILDNARGSVYCNGCESCWDTDDACHWYPEGTCGRGHTQLEAYDRTKEDDEQTWAEGSVHVLSNGDLLCPKCGHKLAAGAL
jgi:hypothetical protein